jgi:predicted Zn finger-like uncharacterized protein
MNVVCGQCGTGYEFDDALVSGRGTTVRCMHCGHQFRVHPPRAQAGTPERWIVRKASGEEYIFRSLSELQRAIAQRRVAISDALSRDGIHFRPMSELSELESFFSPPRVTREPLPGPDRGASYPFPRPNKESATQTPTVAPVSAPVPTPRGGFAKDAAGLAASQPPPSVNPSSRQSGMTQPIGLVYPSPAAHPPSTQASTGQSPARGSSASVSGTAASVLEADTLRPPDGGGSSVSSASVSSASVSGQVVSPPVVEVGAPARTPSAPIPVPAEPAVNAPKPVTEAAAGLPRRRRGLERPPVVADERAFDEPHVSEPRSSHEPIPSAVTPGTRSGGPRWIIALVLLGGLALIAGTVGRDYFERFRETSVPATPPDSRVEGFLTAGDDLFRAGDLEEARAQYEKASALADRDPAVLHRLLQVETARADVEWLRARVLPNTSAELPLLKASLEERSGKLQRRVEELQQTAGATAAPDVTLAIVDALRVQGQVVNARTLIQQASGLNNDSKSAYVSAMLDASEPNPNWSSIVSRLKNAVSSERGLGRAHGALVYALISGGQLEEARQQLEVLAGFKRPSPLLNDLKAMLNAAVVAPTPDPRATAATEVPPAGDTKAAKSERAAGSELRSDNPMAEAAEARAAGELAKAARLYSFALSKEPGNVAAMTGLGDVARSQGNTDIALSHYGAALRANPNYTPAILSCADLKWATGDRAGAVELYKRLGPDAPARVPQRIAEYSKASAKPEPANDEPSPVAEPAAGEAPPPPNPTPSPVEPGAATPGPAVEQATPQPQ